MALRLDHVVILVADLEAASADYRALGFNVQPGGTHADGITHNALVVFADGSYLELIAFLQSEAQHRWGGWARRAYEGFIDFALLPDDTAAVIAAARGRGLTYAGPVDGGRQRPDGRRLQWQTGTPTTPDLPFLCGDITPRALRVREGDVRIHANGVQGIVAITVAVADLGASLNRWRGLLGSSCCTAARPTPMAGVGLQQATLTLESTAVVLLAAGPDPDGGQVLRERIARWGEGLIGITLSTAHGGPAAALPRPRCHGAAIDITAG